MKKVKSADAGFPVKKILFGYLAVTKVLYWIEALTYMDGIGEFGRMFIERMLFRDLVIIAILIALHLLDKHAFNPDETGWKAEVKFYMVGLPIFVGIIIGYNLLLGLFFPVTIDNWLRLVGELAVIYAIMTVFMYFKHNMKKMEAETYLPDANTPEGQIAMLKSLCDAGVLTQEEYDEKCKRSGA